MYEGGYFFGAEGRVTPVDNGFQVGGGDLVGRYVEAEDAECEVGVGQVLPGLLHIVSQHLRSYPGCIPNRRRTGSPRAGRDLHPQQDPSRPRFQMKAVNVSDALGCQARYLIVRLDRRLWWRGRSVRWWEP